MMKKLKLRVMVLAAMVTGLAADDSAAKKGKPKVALQVGGEAVPELKAVLESAGWTMTPEWTDAYNPGDIYYRNNMVWEKGSVCFEAKPISSEYSSMEVSRSLETGVALDAVVKGVRAGIQVSKKVVFDTPKLRQITGRGLRVKADCLKSLGEAKGRGEDLSTYQVVVSVLSARIQKQQCGSYDAKAKLFRISGDLVVTNACNVGTDVPVAVAYKMMPVTQLHPELIGTTRVVAQPPPVGRPVGGDDQSWVKSLLDWDSCDFGVLEKVFHSRGQVPEFSNEEDRSFVNGFAQRAARSASVRLSSRNANSGSPTHSRARCAKSRRLWSDPSAWMTHGTNRVVPA